MTGGEAKRASLRLVSSNAPGDDLEAALATGALEVVLSGCAGTGKTTLVKGLRREHVLCAPTNKAARRLEQVTGRPTTTVHSLIYGAPTEHWLKPDGSTCRGWEDDDGVKHPPPGCPGCRCTREIRFDPPAGLEDTRLVVVDEASMIGRELAADIREAVRRHLDDAQVLWVGDPAQLPPVKDEPGVDLHTADVMLTQVWRADGGILRIATEIRQAESFADLEAILGRAAAGAYADVRVHEGGVEALAEWRVADESRMAITHTNRDRQAINHHVHHLLEPRRAARGVGGPLCPGDRLLLRANVRGRGGDVVMRNSEVYALLDVDRLEGELYLVEGRLDGERSEPRRQWVVAADYLGEQRNEPFARAARGLRERLRPHTDECWSCRNDRPRWYCPSCQLPTPISVTTARTCPGCGSEPQWLTCGCGPLVGTKLVNCHYGYAITAHAAQGSEAFEVGVHWTPYSHRRSFEDARAWLYTAVTRARRRLGIWR